MWQTCQGLPAKQQATIRWTQENEECACHDCMAGTGCSKYWLHYAIRCAYTSRTYNILPRLHSRSHLLQAWLSHLESSPQPPPPGLHSPCQDLFQHNVWAVTTQGAEAAAASRMKQIDFSDYYKKFGAWDDTSPEEEQERRGSSTSNTSGGGRGSSGRRT